MSTQSKDCDKPSPRAAALFVLALALWFGLLTGLIEVFHHHSVRHVTFNWYRFMHQDFLWMTPVMDAVLFLCPALILLLVGWLSRKNVVPAAIFIFAGLLFLKVLLLYGRLHNIALILLVVGLSIQTVRLLHKRVLRVWPVLYKSLVAMVLIVVTLAGTTIGMRIFNERRAISELPGADAEAPNVILITLDTVRAQNLSVYGYPRKTTPQLERWAKKGACFHRAMAPASWTLPTHATLFTGLYPHQLSTSLTSPLDGAYPTLAEAFQANGYMTAGIVANKGFLSYETGLSRGFIHYEDFDYSVADFLHCSALSRSFLYQKPVLKCLCDFAPYGRKDAETINRLFLDWLDNRPDRPFFAFLNYFDAHSPFLPPPPFDRKFGEPPSKTDRLRFLRWREGPPRDYPKETREAAVRSYDGAIAYMDHQLGKLFDDLERRGILDNTVVVITSDHGEHFGEHGLYLHGQSVYRALVHVPLIILFPGQIPSQTDINEYVTLRDLPTTLLDLADASKGPALPGNSLKQLWTDSSPGSSESGSPVFQVTFHKASPRVQPDRGISPVADGSVVSLFQGGKYYIKNVNTGEEELFDFEADPAEATNLAGMPENEALLQEFRTSLDLFFQKHKSRWSNFP